MLEILPNWHPVFVHFTIALLSLSVLFYLVQSVLPEGHHWQTSLATLSKVNLRLGTGFAIITAIAGWFAYNSVTHDTPSHTAMTDHRNWALVTLGMFIVLAFWSDLFRSQKKAPIVFVIAMLIAGGFLSVTGWKGAESVYRYGLGVMSLPQSSGEGHAHEHADGEGHGDTTTTKSASQDKPIQQAPATSHENTSHQHSSSENTNTEVVTPSPASPAMSDTAEPPQASSHDSTPHTH